MVDCVENTYHRMSADCAKSAVHTISFISIHKSCLCSCDSIPVSRILFTSKVDSWRTPLDTIASLVTGMETALNLRCGSTGIAAMVIATKDCVGVGEPSQSSADHQWHQTARRSVVSVNRCQ
jgi:hypothetical protein